MIGGIVPILCCVPRPVGLLSNQTFVQSSVCNEDWYTIIMNLGGSDETRLDDKSWYICWIYTQAVCNTNLTELCKEVVWPSAVATTEDLLSA